MAMYLRGGYNDVPGRGSTEVIARVFRRVMHQEAR